ncbi:hypothetical protein ACQR36_29865 [Rhodococcus erythropolis]|uniref:hypothetical protein n=1 Tax=Rhodococcus erythropolis TaxID=1833 RepID=UPI003D0ACA7D
MEKTITPEQGRKVSGLFQKWEASFIEINNAYAAANITVSNQPTREILIECDQLANNLAREIQSIHSDASRCRELDGDTVKNAMSFHDRLGFKAEELLNAARDNLNAPAGQGTFS